MADKLTTAGLKQILVRTTGVSSHVAGEFLDSLLRQIERGLKEDKNVKINGLGTLKLQAVSPRESVNVVTGERFTIDGYNRVVLSSGEKTPREERGIDPLKKLGEQAEEIVGLLDELEAINGTNTTITEESATTTMHGAETATPVPEEDTAATPLPDAPVTEVATSEPEKVETKSENKPFNPWKTGAITILVFALFLLGIYFFVQYKVNKWLDGVHEKVEAPIEDVTHAEDVRHQQSEIPMTEQLPEVIESDGAEEENSIQETEIAAAETLEIMAIETVGQDSRLAWIAYKYYGDKELWPYIYEANRDQLDRPEHVLPGMKLKIPKLPQSVMNK